MKEKRTVILDKETIKRKVRRMAYEIWERNSDEKEITLIGIEDGGVVLAHNIEPILKEISKMKINVFSIAVNKKNPLNLALDITHDLTGRSVVLVDDVANSGKTLLYSLHSLLSYNLKKIVVAVLIDRMHKSFPVSADIVGHRLATTLPEHIEVETKGNEILGAYLK